MKWKFLLQVSQFNFLCRTLRTDSVMKVFSNPPLRGGNENELFTINFSGELRQNRDVFKVNWSARHTQRNKTN